MFIARLMVQRGSVDSKTQDWGRHSFLASPSPGDRIAVEHDRTTHYLTVLSVHHHPAPVTDDGSDVAPTQPTADVVAIWTGAD